MDDSIQMRYAHSDGHLEVCYDDSGEYIITSGPDGDVRIYHGFDDDDPLSHRIGDIIYCVAYKNNKFYAASDDNTVRAFIFKNGQSDGIVTRFTAHVTHLCFSGLSSKLIAGASDFNVKVVDVDTSHQKVFSGHEAPVLSVSVHPSESFVASSSCDGTVRVWSMSDQKLVKTLICLPKCNDTSSSKTLCRLSWDKEGRFLLVPVNKRLIVYDTQSWNVAFELSDSSVTDWLSVTCLSPCGRYIAGGTINGNILVWNLVNRKCVAKVRHGKGLTLTALAWHPRLPQIAFCDNHGYLGLWNVMILSASFNSDRNGITGSSDLFADNDDDSLLMNAVEAEAIDEDDNAVSGAIPGIDTDVEDDDETSNLQPAVQQFADDGASVAESVACTDDLLVTKQPKDTRGWEPVALQQPFQSGSSPVSLSARFMMWNDIGLIIQYNSEDEQSINVEFHDTATHHAIHVNNTLGHVMADLSASAVLLACEADENSPSQLVCMHFGSWDSCKEWSTSMPDGEDIQALCLGDEWLAVATDRRLVRIFSICGIQKQFFSIPGPIVTMAGHCDMLIVIYHNGLGVPGDQCLAFQLISVFKKTGVQCVDRLPLSPKSTLTWLRFSKEGTPFSVDSTGIVRMFCYGFHGTWVEVADLRQHCKGKSDKMWPVGIHESQHHIRAVLCKGSKYPPVLPRPTVQLLSFQLPLCDISTDKGSLENSLWLTILLSEHLVRLGTQGSDLSESQKSKSDVAMQESLMKLFALACKSGREVRATELCRMMPSSRTVQLAIKYASRLHLIQLAERLGDIARQKAEEEETQLELIECRDNSASTVYRHSELKSNLSTYPSSFSDSQENSSSVYHASDLHEEGSQTSATPRGFVLIEKKTEREQTPKSLSDSQSDRRNPFKVAETITPSARPPVQLKGTSVFDSMEKIKLGRQSSSVGKGLLTDSAESSLAGVKKVSSQMKLSSIARKQTESRTMIPQPKSINDISSFEVWFEKNKEALLMEFDNSCEDAELTVKAMHKYRQLIKMMRNTSENASVEETSTSRKRKRDSAEDVEASDATEPCQNSPILSENQNSEKKKGNHKLSSFMYSKNA